MRTFLTLRALVLAAALTVPLAQGALAQQEQQSMAGQNAAATSSYGAGPYSDQQTAPPVGD
jgi:uncharacterized membrane protein